jgi:hypothetical protein
MFQIELILESTKIFCIMSLFRDLDNGFKIIIVGRRSKKKKEAQKWVLLPCFFFAIPNLKNPEKGNHFHLRYLVSFTVISKKLCLALPYMTLVTLSIWEGLDTRIKLLISLLATVLRTEILFPRWYVFHVFRVGSPISVERTW